MLHACVWVWTASCGSEHSDKILPVRAGFSELPSCWRPPWTCSFPLPPGCTTDVSSLWGYYKGWWRYFAHHTLTFKKTHKRRLIIKLRAKKTNKLQALMKLFWHFVFLAIFFPHKNLSFTADVSRLRLEKEAYYVPLPFTIQQCPHTIERLIQKQRKHPNMRGLCVLV